VFLALITSGLKFWREATSQGTVGCSSSAR